MAGFTHDAPSYLVRANIWSQQIKEILLADLQATGYVNWLTEFPDGDTFNIPSVGQAQVDNYLEDTAIRYRAMDTGNFTFTINQYLSSGTYITERQKQDSFYSAKLISSFVPKQHRAIMASVEGHVFSIANSGQTASDPNTINGASHRWVAGGASASITPQDFAKALYALKKANVPQVNLVAICDPSVEYTLNTMTNLVNVQNNPRWEGVVAEGLATGMKFVKNVYGFDVYTSQFLPAVVSETVSGISSTSTGVANLFFSAVSGDICPLIGAWRQMPKVDAKYNIDFQREEYVTTARYDVAMYRPENMVVVLSSTAAVPA